MFDLKEIVNLEVRGKVILIELLTSDNALAKIINLLICECLDTFEDMEIVKDYKNRRDYFVVMPQTNWLPAELLVEIKKWLKI